MIHVDAPVEHSIAVLDELATFLVVLLVHDREHFLQSHVRLLVEIVLARGLRKPMILLLGLLVSLLQCIDVFGQIVLANRNHLTRRFAHDLWVRSKVFFAVLLRIDDLTVRRVKHADGLELV